MTQPNLEAPDLEGKDNPDANAEALSPDGSPSDAPQGDVPPESDAATLKLELEKEKLEGKRLRTELEEGKRELEMLKNLPVEQPKQPQPEKPGVYQPKMTNKEISQKIAYGTDEEKENAMMELRDQIRSEVYQDPRWQEKEMRDKVRDTVDKQQSFAAQKMTEMGYDPAEEFKKFAPSIIQAISRDPSLQNSPEGWYLKWLDLKTGKGEFASPGANRAGNVEHGGAAPQGGGPTVLTPDEELAYVTYELAKDGVTRKEYAKTCRDSEDNRQSRRG